MIRHIQSPDIGQFIQALSKVFSHIRGYWCVFSHTQMCAIRRGGESCPNLGNKGPDSVHLWVKFHFQNVVLIVFRRKNFKMFPYRAVFLCFWQNVYWSGLVPRNLRMPAPRHCSFCKMLHLKCLTVFWIHLCLDNCSIFCTVTLCYVLHQTHSQFWRIQNPVVFSGVFKNIQAYSALSSHIHKYF